MENKPFKRLALAYDAIYNHLRMCSVEAPSSITEIYEVLKSDPNILNYDRVKSYVKRMHSKKLVIRVKEGRTFKYWLADSQRADQPLPVGKGSYDRAATKTNVAALEVVEDEPAAIAMRELSGVSIPQIKITNSLITISHSKYKLTLELA